MFSSIFGAVKWVEAREEEGGGSGRNGDRGGRDGLGRGNLDGKYAFLSNESSKQFQACCPFFTM